jgi:hypothetical protein
MPRMLLAALLLAGASPALAHGFGQRYDLPIPLSFYVWGAGASVALSFVGFALFLRREHGFLHAEFEWRPRLAGALVPAARAFGVLMLALVILAGAFGSPDPVRNIAPVMVWVIAWVGLSFLSLAAGNVWALIDPWSAAFAFAESLFRRVRPGGVLGLARRYPEWLGVWPAVLLFLLFAWMELVWSGKNVPAELSAALSLYSALTWLGMFVFGRAPWLAHAEPFTLVFATFARMAPLAGARGDKPGLRVRLPAAGLLEEAPAAMSMVALVIALLATVTFDGLLETPLWARIDGAVFDAASEVDSLFWTLFGLREDQAVRLVRSLGLVLCVLLFFSAYAAICRLTAALAGDRAVDTGLLARRFVLTLVPISLAYHVAHYFSLLLIGGQYAIPLVSDPLGRGWNLFGTAGYQVDIGVVTPRLQWSVAVVAVVLGHVIAVYLSHVTALRMFRNARAALASQIPMVLLMIGYTMISLWILSQPIVETGAG